MKKQKVVVLFMVMITMFVVSGAAVMAKGTVTQAYALETVCTAVPGESWPDGTIWHLRGQQHSNIIESDNDLMAGTNTAIINLDVDMETGDGQVWGSFFIEPTAVMEGAWSGDFRGRLEGGLVVHGLGTGQGDGELDGMKIIMKLWEEPVDPENPPPCTPLFEPPVQTHIVAHIVETGR